MVFFRLGDSTHGRGGWIFRLHHVDVGVSADAPRSSPRAGDTPRDREPEAERLRNELVGGPKTMVDSEVVESLLGRGLDTTRVNAPSARCGG